jgi:hypothetical protein
MVQEATEKQVQKQHLSITTTINPNSIPQSPINPFLKQWSYDTSPLYAEHPTSDAATDAPVGGGGRDDAGTAKR